MMVTSGGYSHVISLKMLPREVQTVASDGKAGRTFKGIGGVFVLPGS